MKHSFILRSSKIFIFDVETGDVDSRCVVLSASIIYFEAEKKPTYQQLLDSACFVKFDVKDQVTRLKRTFSKDTLSWWQNQHLAVQKISLMPSTEDVSAEAGIKTLTDYVNRFSGRRKLMWARGSLDQLAIDSLARDVGMNTITEYNQWRDVRTAVDFVTGSKNGYCQVDHPEFQRHDVIKHHPSHDCAFDAMMLMYGK